MTATTKPKKPVKDAPLYVRLTRDQMERLRKRGAAVGMKPVQYVRLLILERLDRPR